MILLWDGVGIPVFVIGIDTMPTLKLLIKYTVSPLLHARLHWHTQTRFSNSPSHSDYAYNLTWLDDHVGRRSHILQPASWPCLHRQDAGRHDKRRRKQPKPGSCGWLNALARIRTRRDLWPLRWRERSTTSCRLLLLSCVEINASAHV